MAVSTAAPSSESLVLCARCSASHGTALMQFGRPELTLDPHTVAAVRRALTGALEVVCRACGHVTPHRGADLRRPPVRAA